MQVQNIHSSQNFNGVMNLGNRFNKKQSAALSQIVPEITKIVEGKEKLVLNIDGSTRPDIISYSDEAPKYMHIWTQVRPATVPTAKIVIQGEDSKIISKIVNNIISEHENSDFYKKSI